MSADIESLQNQRIKNALKLRRRRGRDEQSRFLIDGRREIGQALAGSADVCEVFVCPELTGSPAAECVLDQIAEQHIPIATVSTKVWEKLTFGDRPDGILAVARARETRWDDIPALANPLVVVLEAVEKPGNVGAILRTANAAGVDAVILTEAPSDLWNPNTIRASLGAVFRIPVISTSNEDALSWLNAHKIRPLVARVDADHLYSKADFGGPCAIVLGSEADGVSAFWQDNQFTGVSLPMLGQIDSLNVSSTAAVLLYEAVRQRGDGESL